MDGADPLFDGPLFMPHGHCYLWQPSLVWVEVIANGSIAAAYFAIAFTLAYLVYRGQYLPFKGMALAFGVFIISCGVTHIFDVWVIWDPAYWADAMVRSVTAAASVGTALMLPPLVPKALSLARSARAARDKGVELEGALSELANVYEKTKELDQLKTDFFANVSHELRTPLTLIMGPAQRLLASPGTTEEERADAALILRNARALLDQVEELLDLTRLDAGAMKLEHVRLDGTRLVRAIASNFESLAVHRGVQYAVECPEEPLVVEVDPARIERVVLNLLSNAFKFTPRGGSVRVHCGHTDDTLFVEVCDSGPGIPPDKRELVFERFRQLEGGAERRFGGTGLGLAIAREVVDLHGGRIVITDAAEGGACFRVEVPVRAPEGTSVREPRADEPTPRTSARAAVEELESRAELDASVTGPEEGPLVLVVEDNADMSRFVREVLSDRYRTIAAYDGRAGLEAAVASKPDLVISDLMMPGMSGERLVAELRADHPELSAMPVLLLTAKADGEVRARLLREGAQDYLLKPFDPAELRARVNNLVTIKRATDVLSSALVTREGDVEALAVELGRRKQDLEVALDEARTERDRAERAGRVRDDFLDLVSHELKTPLTSILLLVDSMRLSEPSPPQARALGRIVAQVNRLHGLIEGILAYASLQSGRVEVQPARFDVAALVSTVVDGMRAHASDKGLELELEAEPAEVESDRDLVRVIVQNLLANAIKFTDQGRVKVSAASRDGRMVLGVEDTGPGITPEQRTRIFRPFETLEAVRYKHIAGVGVGLALVRELVTLLGGEVELGSEAGRGTRFTVSLPAQGEPAR